jgi:WD40 repeat protein
MAETAAGPDDKSKPPDLHQSAVRFLFGYDLFISYSRADGADYAKALYSRLNDRGYTVFLDRHEGLYGEQLKARLKALLSRSKAMILVATRHAFESAHVQFELDTFAKAHAARPRLLIPIGTRTLRETCPREDIRERVWIEESTDDSLPAMPSDTAVESVGLRVVARKRGLLFRNFLAASSLIFLAIAVVAVWQWQRARVERDRAERRAVEALAGKLIAESNQLLDNPHSVPISALLAIEATLLLESVDASAALPQSDAALQRALNLLPAYLGGYSAGRSDFTAGRFSPSGDVFLALATDGARVWEIANSAQYVELELQDPSWTTFSRDGRRLASLDRSRVRVWNVSDGGVLFEKVTDVCERAFAFHPNGRSLAIACEDRIDLTDIDTKQQTRIVVGKPVVVVHFNKAGQLISVAGNQLQLRNADGGEPLQVIDLGFDLEGDFETAVDPAGKYFAVLKRQTMHLSERSSDIYVWSMETGERVARFKEPAPASDPTFSPDGKYLAALVAKGSHQTEPRVSIAVYDVLDDRLLMRGTHRGSISSIGFSADGERVATASEDKTAIVWNVEDGRALAVTSHKTPVLAASFHGDRLYTFSDGDFDVWNPMSGETVVEFRHRWGTNIDLLEDIVRGIGFDQQGRFISYGPLDVLHIREPDGRVHERQIPRGAAPRKFFFGGGRFLGAHVSRANTVSVVDLISGKPVAEFSHETAPIVIDFAEDGRHLVTMAGTRLVRWSLDSSSSEGTAAPPGFEWDERLPRWRFGLKGKTLVLAGMSNISIADFDQQRTLALLDQRGSGQYELSADGLLLAVVYPREREAVLSIRKQPQWAELTSETIGTSEPFRLRVQFFPHGDRLALWGSDVPFRVLDMPGLREVAGFRAAGKVRELDFSTDGALLATTTEEGSVLVWDTKKTTIVSRLRHDAAVNTVSFLPDQRLLTGSDDRHARIWNWFQQHEMWRAEHRGRVVHALVSPDTRYVATAVDNTTGEMFVQLRLWKTSDLKAEACSRLRRDLSEDEWNQYVADGPVRRQCSSQK